jgi:hypothetical protein
MGLDLREMLAEWDCPEGDVAARIVRGRDGRDVVQLRIEMGLLQMSLEGRPDSRRHHGMTDAQEFVRHEWKTGRTKLEPGIWEELEREFTQYNYRRVALSAVVDELVRAERGVTARSYLIRALADIDACEGIIELLQMGRGDADELEQHLPTFAFNRARLRAQLRVTDQQFDEAVEEVSRGRQQLDALLTDAGLEMDERSQDPGLAYLRELEQQIRRQYGIRMTLRERLEAAVEAEDFETAAQLRDELRRRTSAGRSLPAPRDQAN